MKRIRSLIILLLACAICTVLSYHFGYNQALQIQNGTFIVSLGSLEALRAGKIDVATQKMEALCFNSAEMIYGNPKFRAKGLALMWAPELKQYRATYRTNSAEWSGKERDLENDLSGYQVR